MVSQSPSFMEYAPTPLHARPTQNWDVAVPIIHGIRSYPAQFVSTGEKKVSQSPSFMEYAPTTSPVYLPGFVKVAVPIIHGIRSYPKRSKSIYYEYLSQSPSFMEYAPTLSFSKKLKMSVLRPKKGPRIVRIHVSNFSFKHNKLIKIDALRVPIVCKK